MSFISRYVTKYHYFFSYRWIDKKGSGIGQTHITTEGPITTYKDVDDIREAILNNSQFDVVIIQNFIPLNKERVKVS